MKKMYIGCCFFVLLGFFTSAVSATDCNQAISQSSINICLSNSVENHQDGLQKSIKQYQKHWSQDSQNAFQKFVDARNRYVNARLINEIDWPIGSSGRSEAASEMQLAFIDDEIIFLSNFEQAKFPVFIDNDIERLDNQLNVVYKSIQTGLEESDPPTGVNRESIKRTQLIWLQYRDAFANFAKIQYPTLSLSSWKAFITEKRITELNKLLNGKNQEQ